MKTILIIFALILFVVGIEVILTWRLINVGNGLADAAAKVKFERVVPSAEKKILIIGDSTAVGTGASDSKFSIAGRVGQTFPNASITNLGVNGAKTHELIPRLENLKGRHFDLVMLHIGGNDTVRFTDLEELTVNIAIVLDLTKSLGDKVTLTSTGNVGTAHLLPFGTRWAFKDRTRKVRAIFKEAAEKRGVAYVDLFREKENDPFAKDPGKFYAEDSFHPSDVGYEDWYTFIEKVLRPAN